MTRVAGNREIFWSVLAIGLLPSLLYVTDIFGWFVEPSIIWFPVYVIGIVPVIVTDFAVARYIPELLPLTIMFLLYILVQACFALMFAWISKTIGSNKSAEVGEIRAGSESHRLKRTVRFTVYVYTGLFVIYWLVSVLLAT